MTSPLRRKRLITRSNTATARSAATWFAGLAIALVVASSDAQASGNASQPSMLKIRAVGTQPAARSTRAVKPTKLKTLAHAPRLQPTPAPPPMFDEDYEQAAYEEEVYVEEDGAYQLVAQDEVVAPRTNGNARAPEMDCTIKNLRTISQLTDGTEASSGDFPPECPAPFSKPFEPRHFAETTFMWKASALCHKPLYFEDVQLERYGHSWGPGVQPVVSSAMFFATVPILPYKMGMDLPWECVYPLGYYRPGDCAPYMIPPVPVSVRGAAAEAAAVTGGILLIP